MIFIIITELRVDLHNISLEHSYHPKGNPIPISCYFSSSSPALVLDNFNVIFASIDLPILDKRSGNFFIEVELYNLSPSVNIFHFVCFQGTSVL